MGNDALQELRELQKTELELLRIFISICDNENIRYFLIGGSCLGAVRHNGFIPWDDDIDVGMLRPDYDRFITCAQDKLPKNVFLQTFSTDLAYLNNYAKLRASDTTFIESSARKLNINHGVFIDIFPIDAAGCSEEDGKKQIAKIKRYSKVIGNKYDAPHKGAIARIIKVIKSVIGFVFFPSVDKCIVKKDELCRELNFEDSTYVANYCGVWGSKEIVPKHYFGEGTRMIFENINVIVPKCYDEYLTSIYGDYMTPPPIEKQVSHHYCDVIDTKRAYKEYINF